MSNANLETLIRTIAVALVDNQDEIKINSVEGETTTIFELMVAKDDVGKVIGRNGRLADAIRQILTAAAKKESKLAHFCVLG